VVLETCEFFQRLSPEDVRALSEAAEQRVFAAGAVIFAAGDPGDGMYVVKEGLVEIAATIDGQNRRSLSRALPGDIFGEMSLLEDQPRSASAIAAQPTTAWWISRQAVSERMRRSPGLAAALLASVSARLREFNGQYLREVLQAERLAVVGRFARSIVHDLKNPLHIISMSAELLAMRQTAPEGRERAEHIGEQVSRINDLVGDILDFTQGGGFRMVMASMDFGAFLERVLEELRAEAALKGVEIQLAAAVPSVAVPMDPKRLRRVFHNLIHNAIEAMQSGGRITVRAQARESEIVTEIADTGPGIAPEIATNLFEAFATHGKEHGTGLGLSISRKIIDDHRGWISGRNDPAGGAVFSVGLPLARPAPKA
jgi:signal transduction histidine kinase